MVPDAAMGFDWNDGNLEKCQRHGVTIAEIEQDLSDLDFSQFKPVRFEFEKKAARVNMRLPQALLNAVKERARARGMPYQRFIREALEQAVTRD
jgi:predicted DNA binding CopG/RHH family protein